MYGIRFVSAIGAVLGVLVMVGCGGSTTGTSSPAQQKAADLRLAQAMVPEGFDFPAGWTPAPFREHRRQDVCGIHYAAMKIFETAHVGGIGYQRGDHPAVIAAASVFQTKGQARHAFRLSARRYTSCAAGVFEQAARKAEGEHHLITSVRLTKTSFPPFADQSAAHRLVIAWNISGHSLSNQIDIVIFRVGRGVAALIGVNENAPFDQRFLTHLTSAIVERARSAPTAT